MTGAKTVDMGLVISRISSMKADPKILLTTTYIRHKDDYYDYWEANADTRFRPSHPRHISYGLRFLKQNTPQLEILEYPTWREYTERLQEGWDVIGFSFYLNETAEILEMAEEARRQGIKELWAGNYGALTEGIEDNFDRIVHGYAEDLFQDIYGVKTGDIIHPPLIGVLRLGPLFFNYRFSGTLFTQRSCPMRCNFCQTPVFCPKPKKIPLSSIERVLRYYRDHGIRELVILDENFGMFRKHTEAVVELFGKYGFYWSAMTRADTILKNLDFWCRNGFISGFIGVESMSQEILDRVGKKIEQGVVNEAVYKLHERNCYVLGYYMIGYETDTRESIRREIDQLVKLKIDFNQLCVVTPLPRTPLWYDIEKKYGIFEKDWHKFGVKDLVWNHPHISKQEMEELLIWGFRKLNQPVRYFQSIQRLMKRYFDGERNKIQGLNYLLTVPRHALFYGLKKQKRQGFLNGRTVLHERVPEAQAAVNRTEG